MFLLRRYGCCCCCVVAGGTANLDAKVAENKEDSDKEDDHDYELMGPGVSNNVTLPYTPLNGYTNNAYGQISDEIKIKQEQLQKANEGKLYYAKTYSLDKKVVTKQDAKKPEYDNKNNHKQSKYDNNGDNVSYPMANSKNERPPSEPYYSNIDYSNGEGYLEPTATASPPPYDDPPKYQEIATVTASAPADVTPSSFTNATYNKNIPVMPNNLQEQLQITRDGLKKTKPETKERSSGFHSVKRFFKNMEKK